MTGLGYDKNEDRRPGPRSTSSSRDEFAGKMTYLDRDARHGRPRRALLGRRSRRPSPRSSSTPRSPRSTRPSRPGIVRQVTGNSYVEDMASGDVGPRDGLVRRHLTLLVPDQNQDQDFQWALPKEGGMLWTDNMVIPKGAPNKAQAERWIDFYYDPANAATIEAYVNYVCPVKGAREVMLEIDPDARQQPADLPARRTASPGSTSSAPRPPRRRSPGARRSPRPWASRPTACAGAIATSAPIAPYAPAARRACSGSPLFYVYPAIQMFLVSLWTGNLQDGYSQTCNFGIYPEAITEYWPWIVRSIVYGGLATILAFALGLPARVRDRLPRRRLQEPAAVPGHRPVLHELPAADDLLEDHPRRRRAGPRAAQGRRHPPRGLPAAGDAGRGHRRHHLQLPAVHDPAAVRRAREDRRAAARGGRGPLRRTVAAAGHDRRRARGRRARASSSGVVMDYGPFVARRSPARSSAAVVGTCLDQRGVHPGDAAARRCRASSPARC